MIGELIESRAVVRDIARQRWLEFWGVRVRVLVHSDETGGKYSMLEYIAPPTGMGPAVHYHREMDESFLILEGAVNFQIGEKRMVATAGMCVHVPPGVTHAFWNISDRPSRMIITMSPGGFEDFMTELSKIAKAFPTPTDDARAMIAALDERFDSVTIAPPPARKRS